VRVVSTQLVEAGVDLDFPVVYRALAGLDSIAQAAGRCNREGKLNAAGHLGHGVVFAPPEPAPPGLLRKGEDAGREMLRCFPDLVTSLEPEAFDQYFRLFYGRVNDFDAKGIQALLGGPDARRFQIQFRSAAERFKLIDDAGQRAVVVWHASARVDSRKLLDAVRRFGPDRKRMRRLQRFTVNIPERVFNAFKAQGVLEEIEGLWAQAVPGLYDPVFGLRIEGPQWSGDEFVC
jgi:CRISPR-associated endonuclease/helicase Cas3